MIRKTDLKQTANILILLIFCCYSFIFKTHYCYHINTDIRFHGDCNHEILSAKEKGLYADVNFFPNHYHCDDYYKDAKPDLAKTITVKNCSEIIAVIITDCPATFDHTTKTIDRLIPEIKSRGGPPLLTNSFRGPPLV